MNNVTAFTIGAAQFPAMVWKAHDPAQRNFYLDTSTLLDAFRAAPGDALACLRPWIEKVASVANLFVSRIHVAEFSNWKEQADADRLIEWLEGLPLVSAMDIVELERREVDYWVKAAIGVVPGPAIVPARFDRFTLGQWLRAARIKGWDPTRCRAAIDGSDRRDAEARRTPSSLRAARGVNAFPATTGTSRESSSSATRTIPIEPSAWRSRTPLTEATSTGLRG